MIVDLHPHVIADDPARYPLEPLEGILADWAQGRALTVERYLAEMDAAGVDRAVLVQALTAHGYDNSYTADSVARFPERFVGICSIDMLAADAPERLSYWIEARGMHGLRVFTGGSTTAEADWLDDPRTFPVWERARALGIPVCVQLSTRSLPRLRRVAERFPDVWINLDHMANPRLGSDRAGDELRAVLDVADLANVSLNVTTVNLRQPGLDAEARRVFLERVLVRFGPERLLWGSNFPASAGLLPEMVTLAREALGFLGEHERALILGGNALALLQGLRATA